MPVRSPNLSEIAIRFPMHDSGAENFIRFAGIALDEVIAVTTAPAAAHQANVFWDAALTVGIALETRHLHFAWVA